MRGVTVLVGVVCIRCVVEERAEQGVPNSNESRMGRENQGRLRLAATPGSGTVGGGGGWNRKVELVPELHYSLKFR